MDVRNLVCRVFFFFPLFACLFLKKALVKRRIRGSGVRRQLAVRKGRPDHSFFLMSGLGQRSVGVLTATLIGTLDLINRNVRCER
jgi:hypothetical protein